MATRWFDTVHEAQFAARKRPVIAWVGGTRWVFYPDGRQLAKPTKRREERCRGTESDGRPCTWTAERAGGRVAMGASGIWKGEFCRHCQPRPCEAMVENGKRCAKQAVRFSNRCEWHGGR